MRCRPGRGCRHRSARPYPQGRRAGLRQGHDAEGQGSSSRRCYRWCRHPADPGRGLQQVR
ncbi:hypothetical protein N5C45_20410 [Pseudomonas mosselii]|nr:hypothetical protein [Pseudomonas mosselii]MDH1141888.1 hypothetical protein [Pseudomonas mosselii]